MCLAIVMQILNQLEKFRGLIKKQPLSVLKNLVAENDHVTAHNREHVENDNVLAINLMFSAVK